MYTYTMIYNEQPVSQDSNRQIFQIGTVRYAEGLWRMRRHGSVIAHCTDSEDFTSNNIQNHPCIKMAELGPH